MTLHYHGTPITPNRILETLAGKCFCVSWARPDQVRRCHEIGQQVMLDNGAFSYWRTGEKPDWREFWDWATPWLDSPSTWAIIPDVIAGDWQETAKLILEAPRFPAHKISPVWHLHDPLDRLLSLCDMFPRVCFGSSAQYAEVGSRIWHERIQDAFEELAPHHTHAQIHMLRGMNTVNFGAYPFYSVDSTDVAQNHARGGGNAEARLAADIWDSKQCPLRFTPAPRHQPLLEIA